MSSSSEPARPRSSRHLVSGWFDDRKMRTKILIVALVGVLLAGVVGAIGVLQMSRIASQAARIETNGIDPIKQINAVRQAFLQTRIDALADEMQTVEGPEHEAFLADIKAVDAALQTFVSSNDLSATDKDDVATFEESWSTYTTLVGGRLLDLARAQRWEEYTQLRNEKIKPVAEELHASLTSLETTVAEEAAASVVAAQQSYTDGRRLALLTIGLGLLAVLALSLGVARRVARPVTETAAALRRLAEGELDQHVAVDSKDEVGDMARALRTASEVLSDTLRAMDDKSQALATASEELSSVSSQMSGSAQESASQSQLVSAAAEQVTRNVQTVATGTEEMSASIREIAQNATSAAGVAGQAVSVAESTSATVIQLGESSAEVGNVISMINSIAEQTNLLALNATIEAARAGEAGKGFAVVANEVKELAQETSKATEDIGRRIAAIQSDTEAAVAAITQISGIIAQINDTQTTIASAVEEQTATTNEMARNVAEAATGSADIAQNITGVARTASDTGAAAQSTNQAADELARMAAEMQQLVARFDYGTRTV